MILTWPSKPQFVAFGVQFLHSLADKKKTVTQNLYFLSADSLLPVHSTPRLDLARDLKQRCPIKHLQVPRKHGRESPSSLCGSASRVRTSAVDRSDGGATTVSDTVSVLGQLAWWFLPRAWCQSLLRTWRSSPAGYSEQKFWSHQSTLTQPPIILPPFVSHQEIKPLLEQPGLEVTFPAINNSILDWGFFM